MGHRPAHPEGSGEEHAPGQIRDYLAIIRLRKWSVILSAGVVLGAALFYSFNQTPIYVSRSRVLVDPSGANVVADSGGQISLETERELVGSTQVAQIVAENLGIETPPEQLLGRLSVAEVPRTLVLDISYEDTSPARAQQLAQGFADGYLEFRLQQAVQELLLASEEIQAQVDELGKELKKLENEIAALPIDSPELPTTQAEINSVVSQISVLEQQLLALTPAENLQVGQVVQPANLPRDPASPDHVRNGILAGIAGLGLGMAVALIRERLDDRLRGRSDLERTVRAPVLAVIPHVPSWHLRKETPIITLTEPKSTAAEAYKMLRTSLLFEASQESLKTILVTSALREEGKTATATNLAVVLAQAGKRAVLVGADLRRPRAHRFFNIDSDGAGLSTVLAGEHRPWEAAVNVGVDGLRLFPGGPIPGNPVELLGSEAMSRLIVQLRGAADFIIIDAAPVLPVADALALASFADGVLFVADSEKTGRGAIVHAREQLEQVNANIIGCVLNNFDPSKASRYPYYYGYYYGYDEYGREELRGQAARPRTREQRPPAPQPEVAAVRVTEDLRAASSESAELRWGGPEEPEREARVEPQQAIPEWYRAASEALDRVEEPEGREETPTADKRHRRDKDADARS
jgi:capsular exopolysaccharide synthesis family protein